MLRFITHYAVGFGIYVVLPAYSKLTGNDPKLIEVINAQKELWRELKTSQF